MGSEIFPAHLDVFCSEAQFFEREIGFVTPIVTIPSSKMIRITVITRSRRLEIHEKLRKDGKCLDS